jgi:hypothetical protein
MKLRFVALTSLVLGSCSDPGPTEMPNDCDFDKVQQAIVGGDRTPRLLPLSSAQERAIVSVSLASSDSDEKDALCTGVVVGPRAVLTARHCLDRDADGTWDARASGDAAQTLVVLGSPDEPAIPQGPPDDAWLHPELDVALLEVGWLEDAPLEVAALLPNTAPLDERWVGAPVELAGYGLSEFNEPPTLRFAIETVARIEPSHVVVDGMGRSGACTGDSGGPLLGRADDGRTRVLGILDDGDSSCVGEDFYTRLDRMMDWEPMLRLVPADGGACR